MKTVVKLILINLLVTQLAAPLLVLIPCVLYQVLATGAADVDGLRASIMIPAQLAGQLLMIAYLWLAGYVDKSRRAWSVVSWGYSGWSLVAVFAAGIVVSALSDCMKWIPDFMEETFDVLQSGWGGILAIVLVGPVFEELLFRGAIVTALCRYYRPSTAIWLSSLLFAVCHFNPAQMLPAFLVGMLLAWSYCRTRSLVPCMLMHIFNNSLSLYLLMKFPDAKYLDEIVAGAPYVGMVLAAAVLLAVSVWQMLKRGGED